MPGQEAPRFLQGFPSLPQQTRETLEDMELSGIPGQGDLNPGSLQPRNQDLDLVPEHFRLTKLNQHGRQTGESRVQ